MGFSSLQFRAHFDFFNHHPDWVYLDNAATMHKPRAVLHAMETFYQRQNSNVHRSAHYLSQLATEAFEQARTGIADFLNAGDSHQVIFQSGATAAFNQLAFGLTGTVLHAGDKVLLTVQEHHANLVPWQLHAKSQGVVLDFVPLNANNQLDLDAFKTLLEHRPKVVSFAHIPNTLGHIQPLEEMCRLAKAAGAYVLVDGAQGVVWQAPDLQALPIDAYVFSGHKLYGPTGIGILCASHELLEQLKPLLGGGEMIKTVTLEHTSFAALPYRLEAGTPNLAAAIGLRAAIDWLRQFDSNALRAHKTALVQQLYAGCARLPSLRVLSEANNNAGVLLFNYENEHPSDVAELLNQQKIAVRAGSHCAMPLFQRLQQTSDLRHQGAVRISLSAYNTTTDIERTLQALEALGEFF